MDDKGQQPQNTNPQTPASPEVNQGQGEPQVAQPQAQGGNGMGVASMVLGIIALLSVWLWFVSIPLAVIALVLGIIARKNKAGRGMAIAGIITSAIAIVVSAIIVIIFLAFIGGASDAFEEGFTDFEFEESVEITEPAE